MVEKNNPEDKLGVYCVADGRFQVVEYSELPDDVKNIRNPSTGKLAFNAGNICSHVFTISALKNAHAYNFF